MTRPRIVYEGKVVALSRRTTRRHFLFNPDEARGQKIGPGLTISWKADRESVVIA